ncbi:MAG: hypothetical protein ACXAD7_04455 [Candidatus Kariarchaeaceae archaeon]|jgi:hypothetical protein
MATNYVSPATTEFRFSSLSTNMRKLITSFMGKKKQVVLSADEIQVAKLQKKIDDANVHMLLAFSYVR